MNSILRHNQVKNINNRQEARPNKITIDSQLSQIVSNIPHVAKVFTSLKHTLRSQSQSKSIHLTYNGPECDIIKHHLAYLDQSQQMLLLIMLYKSSFGCDPSLSDYLLFAFPLTEGYPYTNIIEIYQEMEDKFNEINSLVILSTNLSPKDKSKLNQYLLEYNEQAKQYLKHLIKQTTNDPIVIANIAFFSLNIPNIGNDLFAEWLNETHDNSFCKTLKSVTDQIEANNNQTKISINDFNTNFYKLVIKTMIDNMNIFLLKDETTELNQLINHITLRSLQNFNTFFVESNIGFELVELIEQLTINEPNNDDFKNISTTLGRDAVDVALIKIKEITTEKYKYSPKSILPDDVYKINKLLLLFADAPWPSSRKIIHRIMDDLIALLNYHLHEIDFELILKFAEQFNTLMHNLNLHEIYNKYFLTILTEATVYQATNLQIPNIEEFFGSINIHSNSLPIEWVSSIWKSIIIEVFIPQGIFIDTSQITIHLETNDLKEVCTAIDKFMTDHENISYHRIQANIISIIERILFGLLESKKYLGTSDYESKRINLALNKTIMKWINTLTEIDWTNINDYTALHLAIIPIAKLKALSWANMLGLKDKNYEQNTDEMCLIIKQLDCLEFGDYVLIELSRFLDGLKNNIEITNKVIDIIDYLAIKSHKEMQTNQSKELIKIFSQAVALRIKYNNQEMLPLEIYLAVNSVFNYSDIPLAIKYLQEISSLNLLDETFLKICIANLTKGELTQENVSLYLKLQILQANANKKQINTIPPMQINLFAYNQLDEAQQQATAYKVHKFNSIIPTIMKTMDQYFKQELIQVPLHYYNNSMNLQSLEYTLSHTDFNRIEKKAIKKLIRSILRNWQGEKPAAYLQLEMWLPFLISFMQCNDLPWEENYQQYKQRTNNFFMALLDSVKAYGELDETSDLSKTLSCPDGVLERIIYSFIPTLKTFRFIFELQHETIGHNSSSIYEILKQHLENETVQDNLIQIMHNEYPTVIKFELVHLETVIRKYATNIFLSEADKKIQDIINSGINLGIQPQIFEAIINDFMNKLHNTPKFDKLLEETLDGMMEYHNDSLEENANSDIFNFEKILKGANSN